MGGQRDDMSTGSWIKMSTGLRDHPKVVRIAGMLKADCLRVVGALHAVWSVFDEHSLGGLLEFYTPAILDEKIGWRGFSKAMQAVGWLVDSESGLQVPEYEEHNGPTAKRRATETKRKAVDRADDGRTKEERIADWKRTKSGQPSAADADKAPALKQDKASAADADKKRARGEERREDTFEEGREVSPPEGTPAGVLCRALRQAGIQAVQSQHPTLLALLDAGATPQEFLDAVPSATGKGDPFTYLLSVVRRRREDAKEAANGMHHGPMPSAESPPNREAERTQEYLREQFRPFTPEEKAKADEARKKAMAVRGRAV